VCCVTKILLLIKSNISDRKNLNLYQIKILNSKIDSEAFLFPELLENLPMKEWVMIDKE
jgi:hypothetical protein